MHAIRGGLPIDAAKRKRNQAIVQAKARGLTTAEVARMFGVSVPRVQQICARAALVERFAKEHAESGGRIRVRTLGSAAG